MGWHYLENGKIIGPLTEAKFARLRPGLDPATQVWKDGMKEWQSLASMPAETPKKGRRAPMATQAPMAPAAYAGFGRRLAALVVDKVLFMTLMGFIFGSSFRSWNAWGSGWAGTWIYGGGGPLDTSLESVAGLLLYLVYETVMVAELGATLGKLVFGIRIRHGEDKVAYPRSLARAFTKMVTGFGLFYGSFGILFLLGYLMALWDKENRALHDYLCKTRVYRT